MLIWILGWFNAYLPVLFRTDREFKSSYDKTVFCFCTTKEFATPVVFVFSYNVHLDSIFRVILKEASYKKCRFDVLLNFIFTSSYFLNENILRKSKKTGARFLGFLAMVSFFLVENQQRSRPLTKNNIHVSKIKSFF